MERAKAERHTGARVSHNTTGVFAPQPALLHTHNTQHAQCLAHDLNEDHHKPVAAV